ncbi:MAG: peptidoglycan DD-metalloendopeptidase family protein [Gammaproteobacteria bacterium]|nr:peptidoglycan DD-metalloendopeptidase family protein [Gammaproteobacteria bacterium]
MKQLLLDTKLDLKLALCFSAIFFCGWASAPAIAAENSEDAQQELAALDNAIAEIQSWLVEAKSAQSEELQNLQQADLQISNLSQSIAETEAASAATESEITSLSLQADQLKIQKTIQSKILEQAIRAAYMAGNQSAIELLLNQEDISVSARMLHYHRLFSQAQLDSISLFQETLDDVQAVNQKLESNAADLEEKQLTLSSSLQKLSDSKIERELALKQLHANIASRSSLLEQLEIDQVQLQELIEQINRAVADIPTAMQRSPFESQLGKLPMPVAGQIIDRFGSRYSEGALTRQGITIAVSEGTPVQAIHPGRVVFSDWLRGTGLLVIVDHGQGYMSLYGSNQALSKQAGDWVNTGDILATSGTTNELTGTRTNNQTRPGMYFEIRHHGEAQNPAQWFFE